MNAKHLSLIFLVILLVTACINQSAKEGFPLIKQDKAYQCGPICLKMICQYYERDVDLSELEKLTKMDSNGTSLLGISYAAESLGFITIGVKIPFEKLQNEVPLPTIIHWNNNHFVVIYNIENDKIKVADPAFGKIEYSKKEFMEYWTVSGQKNSNEGIALILEVTEEFERQKNQIK